MRALRSRPRPAPLARASLGLALAAALGALACGSGDIVADVDADPSGVDAGPYDPDASGAGDATDLDAPPLVDTDGDGLSDGWEEAAGDPALLDPLEADSDGDGTEDGAEDYDGDGLTNLEEMALGRLATAPPGGAPHPFRVDLPVELDAMAGRYLANVVLIDAMSAFEALPTEGVSGHTGVGLLVYRDEISIMAEAFDDNASIMSFLAAHGPQLDDGGSPPIPDDKLIHVAVVTRRTSTPTTPASTVFASGGADVEATGAVIFFDVIEETHPACAGDVTVEAAQAAALVHELGHILQLGHDTDAGGGINHYNIMSLAANCTEAGMRFLGTGNTDESLGNTEGVASSRFSWAAEALMQFQNKLSVDTAVMVDTDGVEM